MRHPSKLAVYVVPFQTLRHLVISPKNGVQRRERLDFTWDKLLQGFETNKDEHNSEKAADETKRMQVVRLQNQLKFALATRRSHLKGDLLPHVVATEVHQLYEDLKNKDQKAAFFKLISEELGVKFSNIDKDVAVFSKIEEKEYGQLVKAKERLHQILTPPYKYLLMEIGRFEGGVKFLVDMRKDLLELTRSKLLSPSYPTVRVFDKYLKDHLAQWFAAGFLELEQVTWDRGASYLEKVVECEKVHKMHQLEDLKQRLGQQRRCFIFTHRLLPDEPLVVLHTALWQGLPTCIQDVLNENTSVGFKRDSNTAAFYSISSTQPGLSGIDLGNFMIKTVVQKLQNELPDIKQFGTLSPIPGFRRWLDYQLSLVHYDDSIPTLLQDVDFGDMISDKAFRDVDCLLNLKTELQTSCGYAPSEKLRKPLLQLCARYLVMEKRRNFAFDSVANFHLRNGAILWRLNWHGDKSENGHKTSYGIMVNYKYDLNQIEKNNREYLMVGHIALSDDVKALLRKNE